MSNDKHTKEFERVMTEGQYEPTFAQVESFIMRLSQKTSEEVIAKIVAKTKKTYTTNKDIYKYCKANGIKEDHDPYDNYEEPELDFKKPIDYSPFKAMDDIDVNGRKGIVIGNDIENKKIIVEFDDNDEIKTISYEK